MSLVTVSLSMPIPLEGREDLAALANECLSEQVRKEAESRAYAGSDPLAAKMEAHKRALAEELRRAQVETAESLRKLETLDLEQAIRYARLLGSDPYDFASVFQHCRNLRSFTVQTDLYPKTPLDRLQLHKSLPNTVERLSIKGSTLTLDEASLTELLRAFPKLRFLECDGVRDQEMRTIGVCCQESLVSLRVSGFRLTDRALVNGVAILRGLQRFTLESGVFDKLSAEGWAKVAQSCPQLASLEASLDDKSFQIMTCECRRLSEVHLGCFSEVSEAGLLKLATASRSQPLALCLSLPKTSESTLKALVENRSLRLCISGDTTRLAPLLPLFPAEDYLHAALSSTTVICDKREKERIRDYAIGVLKVRDKFDLTKDLEVIRDFQKVLGLAPSDFAGVFQHCTKLSSLEIPADIDAAALDRMLEACPQLTCIVIKGCSDEKLEVIARRCPKLTHFICQSASPLTDRSLTALGQLHCLEKINFSEPLTCAFSDAGWRDVSMGCKNLSEVNAPLDDTALECVLLLRSVVEITMHKASMLTEKGLELLAKYAEPLNVSFWRSEKMSDGVLKKLRVNRNLCEIEILGHLNPILDKGKYSLKTISQHRDLQAGFISALPPLDE